MTKYQDYSKFEIMIRSSYDAIWTLAVGINKVDKWLIDGIPSYAINLCNNSNFSGNFVMLKQFDYQNKKMGCLLNLALESVNFTGITVCYSILP